MLQTYDTNEPIATSVSMFGDLWIMPFQPLMKKSLLIRITMVQSTSWVIPPSIPVRMWPMEMLIRTASTISDSIRRFLSLGVVVSCRSSAVLCSPSFLSLAP